MIGVAMGKPTRLRRAALIAILLSSVVTGAVEATAAPPQTTSASIRGVVLDVTGAVLVNASLTLTNLETARRQQQLSTADGAFQFLALPPGRYQLSIAHPGFAPEVHQVEVTADQDLRLNAVLSLEATKQAVDVVATPPSTPLIEPTKTSLGRL